MEQPYTGQPLTIGEDCVCERFKHESTKYPREGYRKENEPEYTFKKGESVVFLYAWENFYGIYYHVVREGSKKEFDINPEFIA